MRLRDFLSVPYLLEAETIEIDDGSWVKRVAYPELPGCVAESAVLEDALYLLECRRIEMIVGLVRDGRLPPTPRPPLRDCDPTWVARQVGVADEMIALIDRDDPAIARQPQTNY